MKSFKIKIVESLTRIVDVEAESSVEAISKVDEMYRTAVISLDESDYSEVHISEHKEVSALAGLKTNDDLSLLN